MKDNKYMVTSTSVKTHYSITIGTVQMCMIFAEARKHIEAIAIQDAFQGIDLSNGISLMGALQLMRDLWSAGSGRSATDTINFIVREILNFDGIENYGYFSEDDFCVHMGVYKCVHMGVYKNGDQLN